jgi:hypothetical protein
VVKASLLDRWQTCIITAAALFLEVQRASSTSCLAVVAKKGWVGWEIRQDGFFFFLSFGLVYNVKSNPRGVRMNGERKGGQLVKRDGCIRQEGVLATLEHAGREVAHDRLRLYCEVAQHCIGPPATQETDGIGVNMCTKEGHGAGGA